MAIGGVIGLTVLVYFYHILETKAIADVLQSSVVEIDIAILDSISVGFAVRTWFRLPWYLLSSVWLFSQKPFELSVRMARRMEVAFCNASCRICSEFLNSLLTLKGPCSRDADLLYTSEVKCYDCVRTRESLFKTM